ncbi:MAG: integrase core domain-containing protein [Fuerstiella sp.]|nr:integrase core domain-containing protein [Fuerstiella sp.]
MSFLLQPWHILLAALCGMVNQRQQQIIEFQNAQIEALLKKLGKKRLLLDDDQRRLLAVKAHAIGRKALLELTTIVTPDTILRWHRKLVAKKFDSSNKRQPGRPRIRQEVVDAIDRDTIFIAMREFIEKNTETVLLPPKSPNLNAFMERWFRSLKSECLSGMIFFGQRSLENAVREYVEHYHAERNYQGLSNELIEPCDDAASTDGHIECRERLGGMLKYYHRRAA